MGTRLRFLFDLAAELGVTVEELSQRMSATEYMHWEEIDNQTPIGIRGEYFRAGVIAAKIHNTRFPESPISVFDAMPCIAFQPAKIRPEEETPEFKKQRAAQVGHTLKALATLFGKSKVKTNGNQKR